MSNRRNAYRSNNSTYIYNYNTPRVKCILYYILSRYGFLPSPAPGKRVYIYNIYAYFIIQIYRHIIIFEKNKYETRIYEYIVIVLRRFERIINNITIFFSTRQPLRNRGNGNTIHTAYIRHIYGPLVNEGRLDCSRVSV